MIKYKIKFNDFFKKLDDAVNISNKDHAMIYFDYFVDERMNITDLTKERAIWLTKDDIDMWVRKNYDKKTQDRVKEFYDL